MSDVNFPNTTIAGLGQNPLRSAQLSFTEARKQLLTHRRQLTNTRARKTIKTFALVCNRAIAAIEHLERW